MEAVLRHPAELLRLWRRRTRRILTPGRAINGAFLLMLAMLIAALAMRAESYAETLYDYRKRYIAAIGVLAAAAILLLWCVGRASRVLNRRLAGLLAAAFLAAELSLRWGPAPPPLHRIFTRYTAPYVMFTASPHAVGPDLTAPCMTRRTAGDWTLQYNALGYRGDLPSADKGGEYRIIMLGGSAAVLGTPLSKTIAGQLERLFHDDGRPEVRVYNWGVLSAVSGQELATLVHRVPDFAPDVVVVYDGANDLFHPFYYDPRPGYPYNQMVLDAAQELVEHKAGAGELLALIGLKSKVLESMFGRSLARLHADADALRAGVAYRSAAWERQIIDAYAGNILRMGRVAPALGFKLAVFQQPILAVQGPPEITRAVRDRYPDSEPYARRVYPLMADAVQERTVDLAADAFRFVDLSRTFEGDVSCFWDNVHVDNEGNRKVAAAMYTELKALIDAQ